MMKSDEKYQVPAWMRPLLPLLCNTGGNDPEELLNDTETTASANVVRYVLIVAVRSQVDLLQLLYRKVRAGSVSSPGIVMPMCSRVQRSNLIPYLLVQACQHLWPVADNGVYQQFTCVNPSDQPCSPAT